MNLPENVSSSSSRHRLGTDTLKIPLSIFFGAIRHTPWGHRAKLARRILSSSPDVEQSAIAEVCEFNSLANFASDYAQLATMLDHPGKTPPPGEIEFLRSMVNRSTWYPGAIGTSDYFFLTALVGILAPQRVIEIGTLTGFSAGIIAAALSRQDEKNGAARVDTIDVRRQCLIDDTRPTGFEILERFPDVASLIRLHNPHDSSFVAELAKPNELQIVFVDADHRHPRVLLDLLRLAPYVQESGWIVLHDIQLGTIGRKMKESGQATPWGAPYGAEWLFNNWPFRKISGGNIGAVQLPADKSALIPFALRLMTVRFEIEGKAAARARRALYQSFGELV
jgi:predicted O-methyltransferase YrrM